MGNLLSKVGDLINPATRQWDEDLVTQTFWEVDVQRILSIPLPTYDMEDFVAWSLTKNGIFSVCTYYYAEWDHQHGSILRRTDGMGAVGSNKIWYRIWSLQCPSKVRSGEHYTELPCRVTLANRHIEVSPQCPRCSCGADDEHHLLFSCQKAMEGHGCGADDVSSMISNLPSKPPWPFFTPQKRRPWKFGDH